MAFLEVLSEFSSILNTGELFPNREAAYKSNRLLLLQLAVFRLRFGLCGTTTV